MKQILALDLGNKNLRYIIGNQTKQLKPRILGVSESFSSGISKGSVVDLDDFILSLKESTDEIKNSFGKLPKNISISLAGPHISVKESKGVIPISRADGEISSFDIDQVIQKSQNINLGQNKFLMHVIPREYIVDDLRGIKDPLGMHGIKLEVDSLIIEGFLPNLKTITKSFEEIGLKIEDKFFKPLSSVRAVVSKKQEEVGLILIDLGADTTSFVVFEEGKLLSIGCLPFGSNHITHDIAICLKISLDMAEKIKIQFGSAIANEVQKKETIDLSKISSELEGEISKRYLAEIIEARLEEIFDLISLELKRIGKNGKLPAGIILVGGGARLPYITNFAKNYLRLPAKIGKPILDKETASEEILKVLDDPAFASSVGVFLLSLDNYNSESIHIPSPFLSKIKRIGKMFLP